MYTEWPWATEREEIKNQKFKIPSHHSSTVHLGRPRRSGCHQLCVFSDCECHKGGNKKFKSLKFYPVMLIRTYQGYPNIMEIISIHLPDLGMSCATRDKDKGKSMVSYRKPLLLSDMLVRDKMPPITQARVCIRAHSSKCDNISQSEFITNLNNNKTCNTIGHGTCHSNNLIY